MYRVAERAHILCTASWSQVAKCVPIHSLNITTVKGGPGLLNNVLTEQASSFGISSKKNV